MSLMYRRVQCPWLRLSTTPHIMHVGESTGRILYSNRRLKGKPTRGRRMSFAAERGICLCIENQRSRGSCWRRDREDLTSANRKPREMAVVIVCSSRRESEVTKGTGYAILRGKLVGSFVAWYSPVAWQPLENDYVTTVNFCRMKCQCIAHQQSTVHSYGSWLPRAVRATLLIGHRAWTAA